MEKAAARRFRMDRIRRARLVSERPFTPDMEGLRAQAEAQRANGAPASG
ncbi:hypothetical protein [Corallococcus macrosporus]|nr:hypothetical protein [Corallococcus macrosporus]